MKVAIIQPLYLPWSGFFEMIAASDVYVALDHVKFEPSSWQHRNRIKGPNGLFLISVPIISGKEEGERILDRRIDYRQHWVKKHLRSLEQCYRKAPHFEAYYPELREVLEEGTEGIADLNVAIIQYLLRCLGLERKVIRTGELNLGEESSFGKNERLIRVMKKIGATHFYEGASGRNFVDPVLFDKEGLSIQFQEYHHPVYPQQYGEFLPFTSVVDLLFNAGSESLAILRGGAG